MLAHRPTLAALLLAVGLAGCGEKDEPSSGSSGSSRYGGGGETRTLTGCLELWEGPHIGSTRMQVVAKRQTIYAKVEIKSGRCQVAFASRDGKVYGRYVEQDNATGPWTLDAQSAPADVARQVVRSANATGEPDGSLTPGAPK